MSDLFVLHINIEKINSQLVPYLSSSNKSLQALPTIIAKHATLSPVHATSETHTDAKNSNKQKTTLFTLYNHEFKEHKEKHALVFTIPVIQSTTITLEDNEQYKNHLYIRLYMEGKYERVDLKKYCRVDYVSACIIALPAFMNISSQHHFLIHIPCIKHLTHYVEEKQLAFIDIYQMKDVQHQIHKLEHKTSQSYVESSASVISSSVLQPRTEGHFIKQLKYHYGPHVDVKMLSRHMTTYEESNVRHRTLAEAFVQKVQGKHNIHEIISKVQLQKYLVDENKCAIVATMHQPDHFYKDAIVAFVLFHFALPSSSSTDTTSQDANTLALSKAHIVLDYIYVHNEYDEYVWDKKKQLESNGIRKQLLKEAIGYVPKVLGGYDILYKGKSKTTRKALQCVGFKPILEEDPPAKRSPFMSSFSLQQRPPLLCYRSSIVQCQNWKECLALVKRRHPAMLLKKQLILAKELMPKNQTKKSVSTKPKRSRRAVNIKEGRKLIEMYYSEKYLQPHDISLKSTKQELKNALADSEKRKALHNYCKAVRNHLKRTKKTIVMLSKDKKNTWKFRPENENELLLQKIPEKYALEELGDTSELGRAMMENPFGRSTPTELQLHNHIK